MPPVSSTNRQTASTLGPIDPAAKSRLRKPAGVSRRMGVCVGVAEVAHHVLDVGDDQQHVGVQRLGEHGARQVLVDDGFHALQLPALVADDGHSPAAGADDDGAALQEQSDQPGLHDPLRPRRADDAAPAGAVGL